MAYHKTYNMIIEKKIIRFGAADFTVGKICHWKDCLFLFDVSNLEMLQLSAKGEILHRLALYENAAIKQIDSVLFHDRFLVAADSPARRLYRFDINHHHKTFSVGNCSVFTLPAGSEIPAMAVTDSRYVLLDKGNSMLRVYHRSFQEIKTIGSRMGYILKYEDEQNLRLGFEFPEDMAVSADGKRILIADSGNQRLVLLSPDGKQEKIIRLPEFPFKIVAWDETGDRVFVSDFDCSLMVVSLSYGFIDILKIDHPVDFFPSGFNPRRHMVGSENSNEVVELTFDDSALEVIAREAKNHHVLVRMLAEGNRLDEARDLVKKDKDLLPEYAAYSGDMDDEISSGLTDHVRETFRKLVEENKMLAEKVARQSVEFIKKYKSIPNAEDSEAAHIDKENIRHRVFLDLKQYRRNLKGIGDLSKVTAGYPRHQELLGELLDKRFEYLKPALLKSAEDITHYMEPFAEPEMLDTIVRCWLLSEEWQLVFQDRKIDYERLFDGKFLLAILNDFYFHIAELYREKLNKEQYISFCDMEISMYTDKTTIFKQFVRNLVQWQKYDDVLRMLNKIPDQNKENVNYYYYQVNLAKGNTDTAFVHLKKELDLYPHRVNLIPRLIELSKLNAEEAQQYIDKLLEKSGQSIDTYLHVAQSFLNTGNSEKAELYVDRELELFPENNSALSFKMELLLKHDPVSRTGDYYVRAWEIFKAFIRINKDEKAARRILPFFTILNQIPVETERIQDIVSLRDSNIVAEYREELDIYLSYIKHFRGIDIGKEIEMFDNDTYLTAHSTSRLFYDSLFHRVQELREAKQWEEMFALTENILKYNPGDEKIFGFLDSLNARLS